MSKRSQRGICLVTNIVTNKVVKFDGTVLNDSNITDTGSLITLGSNTTVNGNVSATGHITSADFFKATGGNIKFSAGGNHIFNVDLNGKIYPQTHNAVDLGFNSSNAFRNLFLSGNAYIGSGTAWHTGNDGSGSGLDADTVDGKHYIDAFGVGNKIDFTVNGDADKFYPVVIGGSNTSILTKVQIYRSYSETAPSTWNSATHKGGLTLDYSIRVGSWGGMTQGYHVNYFGESYSTIVAKLAYVNHTMQHCVWLRGGGANYHLQSSSGLSVNVYDNVASGWTAADGWITYNHSNASYVWTENYIDGVSAANTSSASTIDEYKVTTHNQRTKIYNSAGTLLN